MSDIQSVAGNSIAANDISMTPTVDVIEDTGGITLYADLPGVPKDKLKLQMEGGALVIEGDLDLNLFRGINAQHVNTQQVEVSVPRYRRVFSLSNELDGEKAVAEFSKGVLKLYIPKAGHAQPRRINVTVN